jgi:hypothetical protein
MSTNGDSLKRVLPGEPFRPSAAAWNAMLDAARKVAELDASAGRALSATRSPSTVLVKNSTGAALETGHIVGLGAPLFTPTDNLGEFKFRPTIIGAVPTTASHKGKFAICSEQIPDGKIGCAVLVGLAVCQVNIVSSADEYAEVRNSDATKLDTASSGSARILWRESGTTGTKWALVRLLGQAGGGGSAFSARIVGNAVITANKSWKYTIRRVTATLGGVFTDESGYSNEEAVNGAENPTDSSTSYGVGMWPITGITLTRQPIKNGTVVSVIVDGGGVNVFSTPNGYKVNC